MKLMHVYPNFVNPYTKLDYNNFDTDNEQWDIQKPSAQGCDECREGEDLTGHALCGAT